MEFSMIRPIQRVLFTTALTLLPHALVAQAAPPKAAAVSAAEGKWLVRVRGVGIATADKSDAVPLLSLGADKITTSDVGGAELDVSYFVMPRLALSVSAGTPGTHDVFMGGVNVGSFKQMPLTARAVYQMFPTSRIRPYLGAGVLLAPLSDVKLTTGGTGILDLDSPTVGPVGQAGVDVQLTKKWFLNGDVRYGMLKTTLTSGVNPVSELTLNPITFGGGIGYRF
jgi:outer membrane protein